MFACGDDDPTEPGGNNPREQITTVNLTFTSSTAAGTSSITASFRDPDGTGGNAPTVTDPGPFTLGTTYDLELQFLNESRDPPEDVTLEIQAEAEEHQVFFVGDAVGTALDIEYADKESDYAENTGDDLPVGLRASVTATSTGSGTLRVVLKHQPPLNNAPVKTATSTIDSGGTDIDVSFDVTVQ